MTIKILFINAINYHKEIEYRYPPLGLGYLASSLRNHFGKNYFEFKIINKRIQREIDIFKPDIVGISSVTQNYNFAKEYAKIAKEKNISVIMGGVHISMLPESLTSDMDIGIIGEGEQTIIDLMKLFEEEGDFANNKLGKIQGIIYWNERKIYKIEERELINPLDKIPFPDRSLLNIEKHTYVFSSRGCPYRCSFCASSRFWNKVRFFSAEYVVNEINELINTYKVNFISFYDDLFIANKQRLKEIVYLLKKEDIPNKVRFSCSCRANLINDDIVKLLKEMNIKSIGMGLESGCDRTLNYLKSGSVSVEDNKKAIRTIKNYRIAANASFVIGSPTETREEIQETLQFIKDNDLDFVDTYILTPFPGTPVWEYAKEKGLVSDDMDWSKLDVAFGSNYKKAITVSETLSREELYTLFSEFERHRRYVIIKKAFTHPFAKDIPKFALRKSKEFLYNVVRRCLER